MAEFTHSTRNFTKTEISELELTLKKYVSNLVDLLNYEISVL
jgi:hypothetical protein